MKKDIYLKVILTILLFFLIFFSCASPESPEIKPRAILTIALQYEPVVFSYSWIYDSWCCTNCVIITETNGVGGHIESARLDFISNGQAYESMNFLGKHFRPRESWPVCDTYCTIYEYEKVRITITGKDDNDYAINVSKLFDIYYQ